MANNELIGRAEAFMKCAPYLPLGLAKEMIAALKEREPVKPIEHLRGTCWKFYECECNKPLYERSFNYCPYCGRAVKWDDT